MLAFHGSVKTGFRCLFMGAWRSIIAIFKASSYTEITNCGILCRTGAWCLKDYQVRYLCNGRPKFGLTVSCRRTDKIGWRVNSLCNSEDEKYWWKVIFEYLLRSQSLCLNRCVIKYYVVFSGHVGAPYRLIINNCSPCVLQAFLHLVGRAWQEYMLVLKLSIFLCISRFWL